MLKYPILMLMLVLAAVCRGIDMAKSLARPAVQNRVMAFALAFAMVFTLLPVAAFAADTTDTLCEHHTAHDEVCSVEGAPCSFICQDCKQAGEVPAVFENEISTITVRVDGTKVRMGSSLEDALVGHTNITSIAITSGKMTASDWSWVELETKKESASKFWGLKHFTISGATIVEDVPEQSDQNRSFIFPHLWKRYLWSI